MNSSIGFPSWQYVNIKKPIVVGDIYANHDGYEQQNKKKYTFGYGMVVAGLISISLTTLEKRFGLTSKMTGFVAVSCDITVVTVLMPVTAYGTYFHKIRMIASSAIFLAIGSVLFIMPQMISKPYNITEFSSLTYDVCDKTVTRVEIFTNTLMPIFFFILGQLFHGIVVATMNTISFLIIDDNVSPKRSSIYIGVLHGSAVMGSAIGYVLGGYTLKVYGDFYRADVPIGLDISDKKWYGAWYIGFIITSIFAVMCSIPLFGFNRFLPEKKVVYYGTVSLACHSNRIAGIILEEKAVQLIRQQKMHTKQRPLMDASQERFSSLQEESLPKTRWNLKPIVLIFAHLNTLDVPFYSDDSHIRSLKSKLLIFYETINSIKNLLRDKVYMLIVISESFNAFIISAFVYFTPKIMSTKFNVNASTSSVYSGCTLVPAGILGTVVSGFIIKNMTTLKKIKFAAFCYFLTIPLFFAFFFNCQGNFVEGIHKFYNTTDRLSYQDSCSTRCDCSKPTSDLVCHIEKGQIQPKLSYYSYCWASCTKKYKNCLCIPMKSMIVNKSDCEAHTCPYFYGFLVFLFFIIFLTFVSSTPIIQCLIRTVHFKHRAVALGFGWLIIRLLGHVPGPIIMGHILDGACLQYASNGSCSFYHSDYLTYAMLLFGILFRISTFILLIIAVKYFKDPSEDISNTNLMMETISHEETSFNNVEK
ncbi:hypothetical protein A3Q56_00098 [Intoshia linei]|uniref:Solute carrier organic anion transporter family member n=1 Tax=Intoshia linei TaxID=1819745 RepID=A0A177BEI3_9BILA|nr:hypothetical protein A3Q56_00098 [Intoshia linei]